MMIYFCLVIWLLIIGKICFPNYRKCYSKATRKSFIVLFFFACAILSGFRCLHVGVDTINYKHQFDLVAASSWSDIFSSFYFNSMEIGYVLFMKLCSTIFNNYIIFQVIESVIFLCLFGRFIIDSTNHVFLACCVFLGIGILLDFMNVTRQVFAVAVVINGLCDLRKKHAIRAFIVLIIAVTIQISSAVFLISYILYFLRNKNLIMKLLPLCSIFVLVFSELFVNIVIAFFPKYENYLMRNSINQSAHFIILVWLIIVFMALLTIYGRKKANPFSNVIALFCIFYVICNCLGFKYNYFERVGLYFVPFVLLLLPEFVARIKNKRLMDAINFCMVFGFTMLFLISSTGSKQYQNYHLLGGDDL